MASKTLRFHSIPLAFCQCWGLWNVKLLLQMDRERYHSERIQTALQRPSKQERMCTWLNIWTYSAHMMKNLDTINCWIFLLSASFPNISYMSIMLFPLAIFSLVIRMTVAIVNFLCWGLFVQWKELSWAFCSWLWKYYVINHVKQWHKPIGDYYWVLTWLCQETSIENSHEPLPLYIFLVITPIMLIQVFHSAVLLDWMCFSSN